MSPKPEPPSLKLDHIGIAVEDLEKAREQFAKLLGTSASPVEEVPSEGVRVSFFDVMGCRIELLEGTSPESPIRRFIERGRSGVHHISFALEGGDLGSFLASLLAKGVEALDRAPRPGSEGSEVFFVHPRAAGGVLVEFSKRKEKARSR